MTGGSWLVRSSSSKMVVGVSTEDSQRCKRSILQRVLGARNRDPIAASDGSKTDRESVSQEVSRRFTRSDDETRAGSQPGSEQEV